MLIEEYIRQFNELFLTKQYKKGLDLSLLAHNDYPDNSKIDCILAKSYMYMHNYSEALKILNNLMLI